MPSKLEERYYLAAITEREDPRDVLISRDGLSLTDLPTGARLGTSSPRRASQLLAYRPDLVLIDMRGNLDTRLRKSKSPDYDGAVLAAAGLRRIGWSDQITEYIPFEINLPAVGQGALAIEVRADDDVTRSLLAPLNDANTRAAVTAERAFMSTLGGGCQAPVGALGEIQDDSLQLRGVVAQLDGKRLIRQTVAGQPSEAEELGRRLAETMLALGAGEILAEAKRLQAL
jgi:hydroxymethylbilane synthase